MTNTQLVDNEYEFLDLRCCCIVQIVTPQECLRSLELDLRQTHTHVPELNISKVDTCGKNTAQVLPDILHPRVIGFSRWDFFPP